MVTPLNSGVKIVRPYVSVKSYPADDNAAVQASVNRAMETVQQKGGQVLSISYLTGQRENTYDLVVVILYQAEIPLI